MWKQQSIKTGIKPTLLSDLSLALSMRLKLNHFIISAYHAKFKAASNDSDFIRVDPSWVNVLDTKKI